MSEPTGEARFHVERADWDMDRAALRSVRDIVFVREQNVPVELEWDALDPDCDHVLAVDEAGRAIGTGRLTPERKIGRMAVLADWRGKGVGSAMLRSLIERARERGWGEVELHAQVDAIPFYLRHGFEAFGDEFAEADIRHRAMRIALDPLQAPPSQRGASHPRPAPAPLATTRREEVCEAMLRLLGDARHALSVWAPALDPGVLDEPRVFEALRRLAGSGRGAALRFVLQDPTAVLRAGHRLIPLAQRLPSAIELRVPVEKDDVGWPSALALNDVGGYLLRPLAGRWDGHGSTCAPPEHAALQQWFDEAWERAEPATELRRLSL
ncbi:MAG TPA: GNAT family N-acetyltransferase [Rhodanobacteraceae bacterium]|nr:GNAT family N-acetyltransferase [Rhodanobacteraceae bacterium]